MTAAVDAHGKVWRVRVLETLCMRAMALKHIAPGVGGITVGEIGTEYANAMVVVGSCIVGHVR